MIAIRSKRSLTSVLTSFTKNTICLMLKPSFKSTFMYLAPPRPSKCYFTPPKFQILFNLASIYNKYFLSRLLYTCWKERCVSEAVLEAIPMENQQENVNRGGSILFLCINYSGSPNRLFGRRFHQLTYPLCIHIVYIKNAFFLYHADDFFSFSNGKLRVNFHFALFSAQVLLLSA